ncbi:mannitol dehydrogenase family protein [Robbsia sp. KACC 23696]|uniref:mannitol dehydrogenase family protein n=1 Tax=Robbsia sp. KACC 23696 TaxID=3149231 RepID=UPI00325B5FE9
MPPPILQFGTSRFLQAHVDLFVCEAARRDPGAALGKITVVQTTAHAASSARIAALREHRRYPVHIRGMQHHETVDLRIESDSIAEALHADEDWSLLRERIRHDVKVIVSNTGDSGYAVFAEDHAALLEGNTAPRGFAAKLAVLLHTRYRDGAEAITLLPCELVSRNGDVLRDLVVDIAQKWHAAPDFIAYLRDTCVWVNSLVDRIVSEPITPVGAVAEPYALWAIERQAGMVLPCRHDSMILTDDLAHFERLKLFLLNLGHTVLAQCWLDAQQAADAHLADATVRDAMHHATWRATLESVWANEVLPVFAALGQGEQASRYLVEVRDRFDNPFLAHRLADIATHHEQKKQRRFKPIIDLADELGVNIAHRYLRAALRDRIVKA